MSLKIKPNWLLWVFIAIYISGCSAKPTISQKKTASLPTAAVIASLSPSPTAAATHPSTVDNPCVQQAEKEFTPAFFDEKLVQVQLSNAYPFRLSFGSDASKLFILTEEELLSVNMQSGQARCILQGEDFSRTSLVSHPSQKRLVVNTTDGMIHLLDPETGEALQNLPSRNMNNVPYGWNQISQDGSRMVSTGSFTSVRLWNLDEGNLMLETIGGHAAISADHSMLAVSGKDFLQFIDVQSGEVRRTIVDEHTRGYQLIYLLFDQTGKHMYTLSTFSEIHLWDVETGQVIKTLNQCPECTDLSSGWEVESPRLSISGDGTRLVLSDPRGVIVWDTTTWEEVFNRYHYWDESVADATISENKEILAVALGDGTIFILYLE